MGTEKSTILGNHNTYQKAKRKHPNLLLSSATNLSMHIYIAIKVKLVMYIHIRLIQIGVEIV